MDKAIEVRTFKSGNSVAVRLPKALGVKEGVRLTVRHDRGSLVLDPIDAPKRKFDVDKIWGLAKDLDWKLIAPEDRVFDERPSTAATGSAASVGSTSKG